MTLQYPEERPVIPDNYRGVPDFSQRSEWPREMCFLSIMRIVCPPKAIRTNLGEIDAELEFDRAHVEKAPQAFDINMLRCIYCGLCQEVCPEEAIFCRTFFLFLERVGSR